jgi:thiamine kinase-like enzyme
MTLLDPNNESSVLVRQVSDLENKSIHDQNADDEVHSASATGTIGGGSNEQHSNEGYSSTISRTGDEEEELKGPEAYIQARKNQMERVIIDGRPYMPFLDVNADQPETAAKVVVAMLDLPTSTGTSQGLDIVRVSGGITNIIFCVSNLKSIHANANLPDKILVRVFGGHGMIDRDIENSTYAALSYANVAPPYWGRFGNGRLEGWFEELKSVAVQDMGLPNISNAIATSVGLFHANFRLPQYLVKYHNPTCQPSMWTQLQAWLQQALDSQFQNQLDTRRAQELNLSQLTQELQWLQKTVVPSNAKVGFCHNDLLGANILFDYDSGGGKVVQLIDFEYGGVNYLSFDLANHFNEFAGGTDDESGIPNYDWFPTHERQCEFVTHYLTAVNSSPGKQPPSKQDVDLLLHEIHGFILANHLYWGLWGVNQAATEGCGDFDYLLYGGNRIRQYYMVKKEMERSR